MRAEARLRERNAQCIVMPAFGSCPVTLTASCSLRIHATGISYITRYEGFDDMMAASLIREVLQIELLVCYRDVAT